MIFYVFFACIVNWKPPTSYPWSHRAKSLLQAGHIKTSLGKPKEEGEANQRTQGQGDQSCHLATWLASAYLYISIYLSIYLSIYNISMIQPVGTLSIIRAMANMATMAWSVAVLWHTWPWPVARYRGMARPPRSPRCWSSKGAGWHRDSAPGYPNLRKMGKFPSKTLL